MARKPKRAARRKPHKIGKAAWWYADPSTVDLYIHTPGNVSHVVLTKRHLAQMVAALSPVRERGER